MIWICISASQTTAECAQTPSVENKTVAFTAILSVGYLSNPEPPALNLLTQFSS